MKERYQYMAYERVFEKIDEPSREPKSNEKRDLWTDDKESQKYRKEKKEGKYVRLNEREHAIKR
jgi:hypothetical protein